MGLFKSLKGKLHGDEERHDLNSPQHQSPEIMYDGQTTKREKQQTFGHSEESSSKQDEIYSAPYRPQPTQQDSYRPPEGPPPNQNANPPPYQDWLQVPDNSQLPPPPAMHSELSPTNNASEGSAEAGHRWCDEHPVYIPALPSNAIYAAASNLVLEAPPRFRGKLKKERSIQQYSGLPTITSVYSIKSPARADDSCFMTNLPLYFAAKDNPIVRDSSTPQTISFGVRILDIQDPNAVIGVGFAAKPYPLFRQPGWHRCSLAVHADDGRRYINDSGGGLEFVQPFRNQDVIKITMTFYPQVSPSVEGTNAEVIDDAHMYPRCRTRVEFERNGYAEGGWDVHEERDAEHDGIDGLQGEDDLYAAVGACGACHFEVLLWPQAGQ